MPFLNSVPQQMPGFLLKSGNLIVMFFFFLLSDIKIQDAVGKGKSFCPGPWGSSICIPDTLLVLGVSTCFPHMKGGVESRLSPRTHICCRDPKAPALGGVLPQKRGSKTCGCCDGEACGGRKSCHETTRLLVAVSLGRREELSPFCCSISSSLGITG